MQQAFINTILPSLVDFLAVCIVWVFTTLGIQVKKAYTEKVNTQIKKDVVKSTVAYVEQVFTDIHGADKFKEATKTAQQILQSKGINVTDAELEVLIESAVNGFNAGLNKE